MTSDTQSKVQARHQIKANLASFRPIRLVTKVSLGRAGIVMGLEVPRLARNSSNWHRLLEICALADTLVHDD